MKNNALANRQLLPSILALAWMPGGIGILEIRVRETSKNRRCLFLPSLPEERIVNPQQRRHPQQRRILVHHHPNRRSVELPHQPLVWPPAGKRFSNQVGPVRLSLASFQFLRGAAWRASCHRKTVNRQADEA
ncbi:MAG: hypothetical protein ACKO26_09785 [Planctomycetota bacterium]